jgi:hypothetical protein
LIEDADDENAENVDESRYNLLHHHSILEVLDELEYF